MPPTPPARTPDAAFAHEAADGEHVHCHLPSPRKHAPHGGAHSGAHEGCCYRVADEQTACPDLSDCNASSGEAWITQNVVCLGQHGCWRTIERAPATQCEAPDDCEPQLVPAAALPHSPLVPPGPSKEPHQAALQHIAHRLALPNLRLNEALAGQRGVRRGSRSGSSECKGGGQPALQPCVESPIRTAARKPPPF